MAPHSKYPLLVIVGPTASGKSDLAMNIARKFQGEIICADSRTIYRGMDLGTAKPSKQDQADIKHHLLDVVDPGQSFSAFDFQQRAVGIIKDIHARGKLPIMVGGTGLYVDSVIFDYQFPQKPSEKERAKLQIMSVEELHSYCLKSNINLPENERNKRHLINVILRNNVAPRRKDMPIDNTIIVGITTDVAILKQRITQRAEYIFSHGVVEEAKKLGEMYGWDNEAMTGNIYPLVHQYIERKINLEEAKQKFITFDSRLAKRQRTWLRRNPYINWLTFDRAETFIVQRLAKPEQK